MRGVHLAPILLLASACDHEAPIRRERVPRTVVAERSELAIPPRVGLLVREREPVMECEPGQRRACGALPIAGGGTHRLYATCRQDADGMFRFDSSDCGTPLVLAFDGEAVTFTRPDGTFPIGGMPRTEWVSSRTPWLGLDRDGSGCIEREDELFGPSSHGDDGFATLGALDEDHDGVLDRRDPAFSRLVLWSDTNQDRRCTPEEVQGLAEARVTAIRLDARAPDVVPFGSHEGASAAAVVVGRQARVVDVYLAPMATTGHQPESSLP